MLKYINNFLNLFITDADLLYEILKKVNIDHLTAGEQAYKFLLENLKKKVAILNSVLNTDDSKTAFSKREDHPEWFKGLESNVLTKVYIITSILSC